MRLYFFYMADLFRIPSVRLTFRSPKNFYVHKILRLYSDFQSLLGGDIK